MNNPQPPEIGNLIDETKIRLYTKIQRIKNTIASAQEDLTSIANQIQGYPRTYCNYSKIQRQEYGRYYDPGLDLVDLLNSDT